MFSSLEKLRHYLVAYFVSIMFKSSCLEEYVDHELEFLFPVGYGIHLVCKPKFDRLADWFT